jgi:hypothetical protein
MASDAEDDLDKAWRSPRWWPRYRGPTAESIRKWNSRRLVASGVTVGAAGIAILALGGNVAAGCVLILMGALGLAAWAKIRDRR